MSQTKYKIEWKDDVKPEHYTAAVSYLSLIYDVLKSKEIVSKLRSAEMSQFKSKDIFRASGLSLLGISNQHIKRNQRKIKEGEDLAPILLVRDTENGKVIIADGYHRMCAVYHYDEDAIMPCKIV